MSQWDYKIDQPMPGPFPFPNLRKGPGIEVACVRVYMCETTGNVSRLFLFNILIPFFA